MPSATATQDPGDACRRAPLQHSIVSTPHTNTATPITRRSVNTMNVVATKCLAAWITLVATTPTNSCFKYHCSLSCRSASTSENSMRRRSIPRRQLPFVKKTFDSSVKACNKFVAVAFNNKSVQRWTASTVDGWAQPTASAFWCPICQNER